MEQHVNSALPRYRGTLPDLAYWATVVVLAVAVAAQGFKTVVRIGGESTQARDTVQPQPMQPDPERPGLARVLGLFGENVLPPSDEVPQTTARTVFEPVKLAGVMWGGTAERSVAIVEHRGTSTKGRIGTRLADGSTLVDVGPDFAVLARGTARQQLRLSLKGELDLAHNPFAFARRILDGTGRAQQSVDAPARDAETLLAELADLRANEPVRTIATPSSPPPNVRRRQLEQGGRTDPRYRQLRDYQPPPDPPDR